MKSKTYVRLILNASKTNTSSAVSGSRKVSENTGLGQGQKRVTEHTENVVNLILSYLLVVGAMEASIGL